MVWYDGNNNLFKLNFSSLKIYQIIKKKEAQREQCLFLSTISFASSVLLLKTQLKKP